MKHRTAALLSICLLLSGCSDFFYPYPDFLVTPSPLPSPSPIILPSPAPRVLTFGVAFSRSDTFRPLSDTLRYNAQAARLCYESLFELDKNFVPQPLLCASMETEDNKNFILSLRENVFFHDGNPLTAGDVVYSFRQAQKPGGPFAVRLACVSGVSSQADGTVLVSMDAPVWNAAALFDFPIIRESPAAAAPGTGPYRAVLGGDGNYLLPSENWWRDRSPPAERIELVDAGSADELVYAFQYGYISMMPVDLWDTFSPGIHTGYDKVVTPSGLSQYIGFNTRRTPLNQRELRLALALALDRRGVVSAVYGEDAEAAVLPVPPSSPLYLETAAMRYRFDPGESARLIAGLGYTAADEEGVLTRWRGRQTERLVLDFIVGAENAARAQMAEACAAMFRSAGFAVNVRALDRPALEQALLDGDFDLYYAEARPAPNFDPGEFLLPGSAFAHGVSDSAAARSALANMAATDPYTDAGQAALGEVWDVLYEELPVLTVCFRNTLFISQRGLLSGQTPTFYNPYAGFAGWTVHEQ
ncbi:MAG: ABC transporter substrate-binding protein [Oscillospiraceae bacterium]|jgi:peptide/nickel transport system substrate-binding protein|nr:ABC transporter substrate-binding protein [Oscillospiraceae bacterium]